MTTRLDPGTEVEHCKFVQAPAEGMFVTRDEVRFTTGSHHVLLFETAYTAIPTARDDGSPIEADANGVFDCSDGATAGFTVSKLISGSQNADGDAFLNFPEGVALPVASGRVLLVNAHYVNASGEEIEPEVRINLWTIPEDRVTAEGDILFWYDAFIKVEARSEGRARMRCRLGTDITLMNVQSHMHARGTGYAAMQLGAAPFYTNETWQDVPVKHFDGGLAFSAGTWIDYYCDYMNPGPEPVIQGPRSTDEMCMLIGAYYPADRATSRCAADPARPQETGNLGAEWVGHGAASCAETFGCVQQKLGGGGDAIDGVSTCINASDPAISKEMSDALRCLFLHPGDAQSACQAEFAACLAK
ncbi:MAG: hypothetical protein IT372_31495 [Polyangiaceae bacterium]|nr:hypothetical protein [Polyangiaceae bacterium]